MNRHSYDPKARGRYFHVFVESDGAAASITDKDLDGFTLGTAEIVCPADFHVIDYEIDIHSIAHAAATEYWKGLTIGTDGKQAVHIPDADSFDYADFWIFGYID